MYGKPVTIWTSTDQPFRNVQAYFVGLGEEQSSNPAVRAAANALWAKIDREVVDQAPAVFAFNPWDVNVFSARVGNFQHQPVLDVLLDQLWVQ